MQVHVSGNLYEFTERGPTIVVVWTNVDHAQLADRLLPIV
jgi:hypothetical protein